MPDQDRTPYDDVPYPDHAFGQSHPGRLATVASLYGMRPASVASCRVLELGCGGGGNLIPMAYQWPDSTFLGIDRSRRAIEDGMRAIGDLGLGNVKLHRLDIMDVAADLGPFDYVIAHGVYSWVPSPVREKIFDIFSTTLAPQGVGYVSYNCYPGSYLGDVVRRIMLHHIRDEPDPSKRIAEGRALLARLAEASRGDEIDGALLRVEAERIRRKPDAVFFHDDLHKGALPFFLHEVVEDGARHGLQYLSDAIAPVVDMRALSLQVLKVLEHLPEHDRARRDQYLDFIRGEGFRQTLLCHAAVGLRSSVPAACVKDYWISASVEPGASADDISSNAVVEFRTPEGTLATDHCLSKASLLLLGEIWPRAVRFGELLESALDRLGPAAGPIKDRLDDETEALATLLFRAFAGRQVSLYLHPPRLTTTVSDRPEASRVARRQAMTDSIVTNLLHGSVSLDDEVVRRFLVLVDGSRDVEALVSDLNDVPTASGVGRVATRESVERNLAMLARLGLLVG